MFVLQLLEFPFTCEKMTRLEKGVSFDEQLSNFALLQINPGHRFFPTGHQSAERPRLVWRGRGGPGHPHSVVVELSAEMGRNTSKRHKARLETSPFPHCCDLAFVLVLSSHRICSEVHRSAWAERRSEQPQSVHGEVCQRRAVVYHLQVLICSPFVAGLSRVCAEGIRNT